MSKKVFEEKVKKWTKKLKTCEGGDRVAYLYSRGIEYRRLGKNAEAMSDFTEAIGIDRGDHLNYFNRGIVYSDLGENKKALRDYTKVVEIRKDFFQGFSNRGFVFNKMEKFEKAMSDLDHAILLNPKHSDAYKNRGVTFRGLKKFSQARKDFDKAIKLDSKNSRAYYEKGKLMFVEGKYEEAEVDFDLALGILRWKPFNENDKQLQKEIMRWGEVTELFSKSKIDHEAGVKMCTNVLKTCDSNKRLWYLHKRGGSYSSLGKNEESILDFTKAIEIKKENLFAYFNRGRVYSALGKNEEAICDFTKAIEIRKRCFQAFNLRGVVFNKIKKFEKAMSDLDHAILLKPNRSDAYKNRGVTFRELKKFSQARKDFDKALHLDTKNYRAYFEKGKLMFVEGKYEAAKIDFDLAFSNLGGKDSFLDANDIEPIMEIMNWRQKSVQALATAEKTDLKEHEEHSKIVGDGLRPTKLLTVFQFLKKWKLERYSDVLKDEGWGLDDLEFVDSDEDIPEGVKSKVHRKKMLKYILDWKEKKKKKEVEEREGRNWIKIAFVVGVSNYSKFKDPLKGSKVDAEDVRKALKKNGFYVFSAMDMDGGDEEDCLEDDLLDSFDEFVKFRRKYWEKMTSQFLKDRLFTLFFFAGHGLFTGTSQCLIPEDFDEKKLLRKALKITKESKDNVILKAQKKIMENALSVRKVINALSDEGKLVLLLDCCRNDVKFTFELEPEEKRSIGGSQKRSDIIVSYSTKIGKKADDVSIRGRNSPYTRALLKNFEKGKGEKIEDILKAVREDVLSETQDHQEPVFEDKQLKNSVFTW